MKSVTSAGPCNVDIPRFVILAKYVFSSCSNSEIGHSTPLRLEFNLVDLHENRQCVVLIIEVELDLR